MPSLPTSSSVATKNCLPCASIGPVQDSLGACARRAGFSAKSFSSACRSRSRQPSPPNPFFEASTREAITSGAAVLRVGQRARPSDYALVPLVAELDKMRMSYDRMRRDIKRIKAEQAKAAAAETPRRGGK